MNLKTKRFVNWVESYNRYYNSTIQISQQTLCKNHLKDARLSEFKNAEGSFSATQRTNRNTFRMRFSLKQNDAFLQFLQLKNLWIPILQK